MFYFYFFFSFTFLVRPVPVVPYVCVRVSTWCVQPTRRTTITTRVVLVYFSLSSPILVFTPVFPPPPRLPRAVRAVNRANRRGTRYRTRTDAAGAPVEDVPTLTSVSSRRPDTLYTPFNHLLLSGCCAHTALFHGRLLRVMQMFALALSEKTLRPATADVIGCHYAR